MNKGRNRFQSALKRSRMGGTYTIKEPTDLDVTMELKSGTSCPSGFNREIDFKNHQNKIKRVTISFTESKYINCKYTGKVASWSKTTLKSLAKVNNRSYWDRMYLTNYGASTTLYVQKLEVRVKYSGTNANNWLISGLTAPGTLRGNMTSRLSLSSWKLRACEACEYLNGEGVLPHGCSSNGQISQCVTDLNNYFDRWTREFIYDIGKSGSDATDNNGTNPKYGDDEALCTDTVSWYYSRYAYTSPDNYGFYTEFKDLSDWGSIRKVFWKNNRNRLYCYNNSQWKQCKSFAPWDNASCTSWGTATIEPEPGDVAIRSESTTTGKSGHAMSVVGWDSTTKELHVLEGPVPVQFRAPIDVQADIIDEGKTMCIGRIPDND